MATVETSQAGPGNLEVTVNGGAVPTSAQAHGLHTYAISFTPKEAHPHRVELKFNGEDVPGSPFVCHVIDAQKIRIVGQQQQQQQHMGDSTDSNGNAASSGNNGMADKTAVHRPTTFTIDIQGCQVILNSIFLKFCNVAEFRKSKFLQLFADFIEK